MNQFQRHAQYLRTQALNTFSKAYAARPYDGARLLAQLAAEAEAYVQWHVQAQITAAAELEAARQVMLLGNLIEAGELSEAEALNALRQSMLSAAVRQGSVDAKGQRQIALVATLALVIEKLKTQV